MDRGELLPDLGQPVAEAVGEQNTRGEVERQGQQGLARGGPVSTAGIGQLLQKLSFDILLHTFWREAVVNIQIRG